MIRIYSELFGQNGTTCAPFLATRVLKELAIQEKERFPRAAHVLSNDFYVDDLISGADNEQEARRLVQEVNNATQTARLPLRKWTSNKPEILNGISTSENNEFLLNKSIEVSTLGLSWNTELDTFNMKTEVSNGDIITKRTILSIIARMFDPLGLLSPITVTAKWFLQQMWMLGLKWDEEITGNLKSQWCKFCNQLRHTNLYIPRTICKVATFYELHAFSDASQIAYSACIYLKSVSKNGEAMVRLICAKTRVAPVKQISIPKLELCGAVLTAKLLHRISSNLKLSYSKVCLWTDSTVVLSWLTKPPIQWKPFVSNRVTTILEQSKPSMWRHVPSEFNPADVASRGLPPQKLPNSTLWWNGPQFLLQDESGWPQRRFSYDNTADKEARKFKVHAFAVTIEPDIFIRFSSFDRLVRIVAYCFRFASNVRLLIQNRNFESLRVEEINNALCALIKIVQQVFKDDIAKLKAKNRVGRKSKLKSLNPYLDQKGILRVGGRLQNANLGFNQTHPIILPPKHPFTTLLIRKKHEDTLHGGTHLVHSGLRLTYWIVDGKSAVKKFIRSCVTCRKAEPRPQMPIMGELPTARITIDHLQPLFVNCGIDYGGPFPQRIPGRRGTVGKLYVALFICMATKAVHLEAVGSLSADDFLACFHRFVARKGKPRTVYSDNGTNLVGAFNELAKQRQDEFTSEGIQWKFIPPGAPNFGGLWEAGIKSVKTHLKRTIGDTPITFEEFSTILARIELCLNNRPLYSITTEDVFESLTPNHFLLRAPVSDLPEETVSEGKRVNLTKRLEMTRRFTQAICKRWMDEYLHTMQTRQKWFKKAQNLNPGDIVMVKPDNPVQTTWIIGRVTAVFPGNDKQVRVVTVQTARREIKRPVNKVALLPIEPDPSIQS